MSELNAPDPVDQHVGARVRIRRKMLGFSQQRLAGELGLTFQQVQKYENGVNRVSASTLYRIAKALQVTPAYFFEGLTLIDPAETETASEDAAVIQRFLMTPEGLELARRFPRIESATLRRQVLRLVQSMADDRGEETDVA